MNYIFILCNIYGGIMYPGGNVLVFHCVWFFCKNEKGWTSYINLVSVFSSSHLFPHFSTSSRDQGRIVLKQHLFQDFVKNLYLLSCLSRPESSLFNQAWVWWGSAGSWQLQTTAQMLPFEEGTGLFKSNFPRCILNENWNQSKANSHDLQNCISARYSALL